jgi:serine/threonine protein kinase
MKTLAGHYQLQERLGSGGTASVWKALDVNAEHIVAVKFVSIEGTHPVMRDRLRDEARVMASLTHPHLLKVYELGTDERTDWIAMEYCPGGSLAHQLLGAGPLPASDAARFMMDILDALQFAHERGVIHRDVKPANIFIGEDGKGRLGDFGIARIVTPDQAQRTQAGLGSWPFMAPEQRLDAAQAGPPADIYSAGATLYNLLTATTPTDLFLAPDTSPRWDGVPEALRPLLRKATSAEPTERHGDAHMLRQALALLTPLLPAAPMTARPVGRPDDSYTPTNAEGDRTRPADSTPRPPPTIVESSVRSLYIDPLGSPRGGRSMQAVPLPKAKVNLKRVFVLFRRVSLGLGVLIGLWFAALHLLDTQLPLVWKGAVTEQGETLSPAGAWRGNWGRYPAALHLTVEQDEFYGDLIIELPGGHRARIRTQGTFDPEQGILQLKDTPLPSGESSFYRLQLSQDGLGLTGHIDTAQGEREEFRMVRQ